MSFWRRKRLQSFARFALITNERQINTKDVSVNELNPKLFTFNSTMSLLPLQVLSQETQPLSPTELQTLLNFLYAPNDELFALQVRPSHC